ncbi:hypothetical protein [uncultured Roseibium sp.]|uniref:hypothetical protein n=1 Tax=uncultured Roseibium sp. TaxID=1936171 RepID=UPI0032161F7A
MIDVNAVKKEGYEIKPYSNNEIYVVRNFLSGDLCKHVVRLSHEKMKTLSHRKEEDGFFYSIDVLPSKVETDRIFRTIQFTHFDNEFSGTPIESLFKEMVAFQSKFVTDEKRIASATRRIQIIHYPRGGGFFDWHQHPRYPVNYGLILNLSKKGKNFDVGATEIVSSGEQVLKVEDYSDIGDLILFRYDLKHRVAPCNPEDDLCFDTNGRWTAILPIY